MSEELKEFNINLEDIKESNNLFDDLHEAIEKMRLHTLSDRFEVVLNNNLIESKEKLTNFRTILGCRISYDNLDKNISFIVREDNKPSYEELENKINILNNIIKIMENYLELIYDLGYDHDGLETTGDLMNLMDELVRYASLGRAYNITEPIYENIGKKYNILHEELKENNK